MSAREPLLILLDGHAMVYRAFYAIQNPMTVSTTGEEVRGVYGFLNTFLRNLSDLNPTHCAISFDLSGPTFRHDEYDEYKAQRPPMPPELRQQVERVREVMGHSGSPCSSGRGTRRTTCWAPSAAGPRSRASTL